MESEETWASAGRNLTVPSPSPPHPRNCRRYPRFHPLYQPAIGVHNGTLRFDFRNDGILFRDGW